MATVTPYISEGVQAGQKVALKIRGVRMRKVGHGQLKTVSDFEIVIDGHVELAVYEGDVQIRIALPDPDEAASNGPCSLYLNTFNDDAATYRSHDGSLTIVTHIDGNEVQFKLSRLKQDNMTECVVSGPIDLTAYIEPIDS